MTTVTVAHLSIAYVRRAHKVFLGSGGDISQKQAAHRQNNSSSDDNNNKTPTALLNEPYITIKTAVDQLHFVSSSTTINRVS
jgi:hypothetical protein